ncbi:energy-coupling factor transporter transmembrane component T, partial [Butyrivibrio sp. NC3005]|uniref:energy-coupling factor transporter transmembrane component T n=1 Tax=Butyrivibrio sp. NC3005 TaxID=1280685 RepID=UPI00055A930F
MDSILKQSRPGRKQLFLDPRTKIFLCLTVSFLTLAGNNEGIMKYVKICIAVVPLLFLLVLRKRLMAAYYTGLYVFSLFALKIAAFIPPIINVFFTGVIVTSTQAIPSMSMFCFMIMTTSVSEFIAAMDKFHVPKKMTVPISSM